MRALVLAGGGSRGSWEAGALKYMGESGLFKDGFDFVSGTSVGAINAAGVAQFPKEKFRESTVFIEDLWLKHITKTSDVWSLRFPVGIPGLWNPSVGKNIQLETLLTKLVDIPAIQASGVQVRFASVDVESGELVIHSGEDLLKHGVQPIMSSASYPMAFPPVEIDGKWLTDGGVRDTAPLGAAIKAGADEIVVLTTRDPKQAGFKDRKKMGNVATFGQRCLSIQFHEVLQNDIALCQTHNHYAKLAAVLAEHGVAEGVIENIVEEMEPKKEVKLTVLYPLTPLGTSLDFSGDVMTEQIKQGYSDAQALLGG
ncbi:patatin-like phospholipase family protein [Deltaproteobacteria bacterium]|nr:patatin-like phospholipase family protein [Deltaproteobacteria bacterium]